MFTSWCCERDIHPFAPTLPNLLNFFSFLHSSQHLSVSSILGYWAALSPIFKLAGSVFGGSVILDLLFQALHKGAPKGGRPFSPLGRQCGLTLPGISPLRAYILFPSRGCSHKSPLSHCPYRSTPCGCITALSFSVGFGRVGSALLSFHPVFLT